MANYSDKAHEKYLSDIYLDEYSIDDAMDRLIYLTSPNRGKDNYITEKSLKRSILGGRAGTVLRRYDPIAFYTSKNDRAPEVNVPCEPQTKTVEAYGYRYNLILCERSRSSPYPNAKFMGVDGYVLKSVKRIRP